MPRLVQKDVEFTELGAHQLEEGDTIVFTRGMVDIHSHGRDNNRNLGKAMTDVLSHSAKQFGHVLLMPNLAGPDALVTRELSLAYHQRATACVSPDLNILSTVYLNKDLTREEIRLMAKDPRIAGAKFYPEGGTTNSDKGLRIPQEAAQQLEWMQEFDFPLLIHGELRTADKGEILDPYDREKFFYHDVFPELDRMFPELRMSCEHLSTGIGMQAVVDRKGPTFGTCTPLHLRNTRTDVMDTGVDTTMVMKPMVQHERELPRIWDALLSRPERFGAGSDDAWHPTTRKHCRHTTCGAAYGPYRVGYYLEAFELHGALEHFTSFMGPNAASFHQFILSEKEVVMQKGSYVVTKTFRFGDHITEPVHAGEERTGWLQVFAD